MAIERMITAEELRRIARLAEPTGDDVTVLADGTRLDTVAKIVAYENAKAVRDGLAPVSREVEWYDSAVLAADEVIERYPIRAPSSFGIAGSLTSTKLISYFDESDRPIADV